MDFQVDQQLGRGNGHGTDKECGRQPWQHYLLRICFNNLMNALAGILPNWSETYVIHKGDEVENGTITFRVAANYLRRLWTGIS